MRARERIRIRIPHVNGRHTYAVMSVVVVVVVIVLARDNAYVLQLASTAALTVSVALGLNIVLGICGQMSFAQAALFGIGGYTSAILLLDVHAPFLLAFVGAVFVAAVAGLLVGLPSLRLSGAYFAIATISLQIAVIAALNKGGTLTGGGGGLGGIPRPALFGYVFNGPTSYAILCGGWLLVVMSIVSLIRNSRLGWEMRITGVDEELAGALGISAKRRKLIAFLLSAAIAGGAGSLYAGGFSAVDPGAFGLDLSAILVVMVLVGGRGSVIAVSLSAAVLTTLPEYLRAIQDFRLIVFGGIMVIVIILEPDGIVGLRDRLVSKFSQLRRRGQADLLATEGALGPNAL